MAFALPQALPVLLVNRQLLPLPPPHPDPQLSPLAVPVRLLRHAAAALPPLQPAGGSMRFIQGSLDNDNALAQWTSLNCGGYFTCCFVRRVNYW